MKKLISLLCALAMCLSLVACGGTSTSQPESNDTQANDTQEETPAAEPETEPEAEPEAEPAASTDYPAKNVTIICPYGAGGGTDLAMRILAESAEPVFGQAFTVENKTGGSGSIGLTEALAAEHDGYTLVTASVDLITLPLLGLAPAEVSREAFDPICIINGEPAAIIVSADSEYETIEDFINAAKENPGSIQLANAGMGNIWHLAAIGLELQTGASFTHIPYDGGTADAIAAVLGGHVDAIVCSAAEAASNIAAGEMRVLAVANTERLAAYPDVPTFQELGIDLTVVALRGLCVPSDIPEEVRQALKDGFEEVINSDTCKAKVEEAGMTYMPLNAEETNEILDSMSGNFESIISTYLESAS